MDSELEVCLVEIRTDVDTLGKMDAVSKAWLGRGDKPLPNGGDCIHPCKEEIGKNSDRNKVAAGCGT